VATHRESGEVRLYVGKTGDNFAGCNPVISRAGNHFSFNKIHSQMRNHLHPEAPAEFDFDYFYTTFDAYNQHSRSKGSVDVINEMERRLNRLIQESFEERLLNPYGGKYVSRAVRPQRDLLVTDSRLSQLRELAERVKSFLAEDRHQRSLDS
jgi:hypothetical protein